MSARRSSVLTLPVRLAVVVAVVAFSAGIPREAGAATITFKCAFATLNDMQHEWCKRYGARLEKRTIVALAYVVKVDKFDHQMMYALSAGAD